MLNKKVLIIVGIVIFFISLLSSLYFWYKASPENTRKTVAFTPTSIEENYEINLIGEIASFDAFIGIESFKNNAKHLDSVSAFLYDLNSDGTISFIGDVTRLQEIDLVKFAHENNVQILLGIGNDYKPDRLNNIFSDEVVRENHIANLAELIIEGGYDGVAVDFENLQDFQTDLYTGYLRELVSELKSQDKYVAVAVNTETRGSILDGIDIVKVANIVDRLDFNSFDEFGPWSGPGPIASIGWLEEIIRNLINQGVSPQKIVVGTATSGKDWLSNSEDFYRDLTVKEYLDFSLEKGADLVWDGKSKSYYFNYEDTQRREHIVWLEDAQSTKAKIELAKKYRLNGVFIWFLGGEDPKLWEQLSQ